MLRFPVLNSQQARDWDRLTSDAGLPAVALMESAGRAVAAVVTTRFPRPLRQGVLIAAGPGNNGGDGWVIARALAAQGVGVWVVGPAAPASELCRLEARLAREAGVREVDPNGPWPTVGLVIDALLGTGASGPPRPAFAELLGRLEELVLPVVAVDGPTGLDLDTGVSHRSIRTELTITFGGYRRGQLLARDEVGDVVVVDCGFAGPDPAWPRFFTEADAARAALPLGGSSHKGSRGRVVILGGDAGMTGAARLAARSAFAGGAGLVHVIAPAESVAVLAAAEPDLQTTVSSFDALSAPALALLARADAVVIGPGLGRAPGRLALVEAAARATPAPLVIDADGLMAFAGHVDALARCGGTRPIVITPHAGEFRALFPSLASDLATDPWRVATEAAALCGATVLLKGVPTVVARPGEATLTVAAGNPSLATGGSGDTLAGLLAAWLGQDTDPVTAAALAARALGDASDFAARRFTARGARPMDVIAALGDVWRLYDRYRRAPTTPPAPVLHELAAPIRV